MVDYKEVKWCEDVLDEVGAELGKPALWQLWNSFEDEKEIALRQCIDQIKTDYQEWDQLAERDAGKHFTSVCEEWRDWGERRAEYNHARFLLIDDWLAPDSHNPWPGSVDFEEMPDLYDLRMSDEHTAAVSKEIDEAKKEVPAAETRLRERLVELFNTWSDRGQI